MMVELHFQNLLNKESIDRMRGEHGFRDSLPLEKFIMDFEMLTHIQEVLGGTKKWCPGRAL